MDWCALCVCVLVLVCWCALCGCTVFVCLCFLWASVVSVEFWGGLGFVSVNAWAFGVFYKNIEKRQLWVRPMGGWNSTLQAAWYVRHAHWACLCYVPIEIWCLWITSTISLLILSSTGFISILPNQLIMKLRFDDSIGNEVTVRWSRGCAALEHVVTSPRRVYTPTYRVVVLL